MTLLTILAAAVGLLVALVMTRLPRPIMSVASLVLIVAYLVAITTLEVGSNAAQLVAAATNAYVVVVLVWLVAVDLPQRRRRRQQINAADIAARRREPEQIP